MIALPRLYAIADASYGNPVQLAKSLFEGGARLLQVRHKAASSRKLLADVEDILNGAPDDCSVIVNDRADVALISGAQGVHLGQTDLPPDLVRGILPAPHIIGFSTHNLEQAIQADKTAADYIAVGPIFATATKTHADPVVGLDELRRICSVVTKPVVAIGGVNIDTARDVLDCGASSVAVIGDLLRCSDVTKRTAQYLNSLSV
jgi:thiamine-phosphate pyrophosphorylase